MSTNSRSWMDLDDNGLDLGRTALIYEAIQDPEVDDLGEEGLMRIGNYLVDAELGEGGGGNAYRGVKIGSERHVTVKLLRQPLTEEESLRRAWRELDVLEHLSCPAVPRLHEHGTHDGQLFLVYDHIDGLPLDEYCRVNLLDRPARVRLLVATARAVQELHERGFIHRDVKPANVLVDDNGRPILIDLGLAMLSAGERHATREVVGSAAFMAPEQAGDDRDRVSTRSDIYALGATACLLLTGHTPHEAGADLRATLRRVVQEPIRDPGTLDPDLPRPLAAILRRAMARRPEDRFATAGALADDLQRWLDHRPVQSLRRSWWRDRWLAIRRQPRWWSLGITAAVIIIGLVSASAYGQARHVQSRLELLEELETKQDRIDRYLGVVAMASERFIERLDDKDLAASLQWLSRLEDHAVGLAAVEADEGPEVALEVADQRAALTLTALEIIHDADGRDLADGELAVAAVNAICGPDAVDQLPAGLWCDVPVAPAR